MSRADGRTPEQVRELYIKYDRLAKVDGSARFGFGPNSHAIASISGPIEVRLNTEQASQATFEVHLRPLANVPGTEAKTYAANIASALLPSLILSQNPRSLIQLVIQVIASFEESSPKWKDSLIPSMLNASTLALLNAGSIPMRGVVCAVFVGRISSPDGHSLYVVDPTSRELGQVDAAGCFAFLFAHGDAVCVWTNWWSTSENGFSEKELLTAREIAKIAAGDVWERMKKTVAPMLGRGIKDIDEDIKMEIS